MNTIQQRMNAFTTLKDGSTSGDAELQDIRVAYDGRLYEGAGSAVRAQTADLYEIITGADSYAWNSNTYAPIVLHTAPWSLHSNDCPEGLDKEPKSLPKG